MNPNASPLVHTRRRLPRNRLWLNNREKNRQLCAQSAYIRLLCFIISRKCTIFDSTIQNKTTLVIYFGYPNIHKVIWKWRSFHDLFSSFLLLMELITITSPQSTVKYNLQEPKTVMAISKTIELHTLSWKYYLKKDGNVIRGTVNSFFIVFVSILLLT